MTAAVTGLLVGVFDLFNAEDLGVIANARTYCDRLLLGVVSDELAAEYLGDAPYICAAERLEIVASLRNVDGAVPVASIAGALASTVGDGDVVFLDERYPFASPLAELATAPGPGGARVIPLARGVLTTSLLVRAALDQNTRRADVA